MTTVEDTVVLLVFSFHLKHHSRDIIRLLDIPRILVGPTTVGKEILKYITIFDSFGIGFIMMGESMTSSVLKSQEHLKNIRPLDHECSVLLLSPDRSLFTLKFERL